MQHKCAAGRVEEQHDAAATAYRSRLSTPSALASGTGHAARHGASAGADTVCLAVGRHASVFNAQTVAPMPELRSETPALLICAIDRQSKQRKLQHTCSFLSWRSRCFSLMLSITLFGPAMTPLAFLPLSRFLRDGGLTPAQIPQQTEHSKAGKHGSNPAAGR